MVRIAIPAADGGASFHIQGAPIAADAAVITAGIDFDLGRSTSVGFGYAGQLGEDPQSHSLEASLTKSF
ncbi:hypothetical protein ACJ5NV_10510 [Loktanella agnita]|uniref:hypothetical protein n=1 Tax=Loktanella agnita TaxID=287097 RepID=UPI0039881116